MQMKLPERGAALATGLALTAGMLSASCENEPQSNVPDSIETPTEVVADYFEPPEIDQLEVTFVEIPGSTQSTPEEQAKAVSDVAASFTIWQATSHGELFPETPEVVNGGEHKLESGTASDVCEYDTRNQMREGILTELGEVGENEARIIVMNGLWEHCSDTTSTVSAEAIPHSREFVAYDGIGAGLAAHENGHSILGLSDSMGYECDGASEATPVINEACEERSHQDLNTHMSGLSSSANDHDRLSGPEMYRLNLINPEQIVQFDEPGTTEFELNAIFNPDETGTKLITVPLANVAGFDTVLATGADTLAIELSGDTLKNESCGELLCPDAPENLSVKVYMIDENHTRTEVDHNGDVPTFYQLYLDTMGGNDNSNQAGQEIKIEGEKGSLIINIEDINVTAPAQGQAQIKVTLAA